MSLGASPNHPQRWVGIGAVIALHLVILYALVAGLKRNPADLITQTVDVRLVEEAVRTAPAAPPQPQPTPPKPPTQAVLPKTAVPPPKDAAPIEPAHSAMPQTPAMTQAPSAPAADEVAPAAPTAPVAPPAPAAASAPVSPPAAAVVCPGYQDAIRSSTPPREALQEGIGGEVLVEFTVAPDGTVRNPIPIRSTNPRLNRWALATVLTKIRCQGQTQPVQLRVPIGLRFE